MQPDLPTLTQPISQPLGSLFLPGSLIYQAYPGSEIRDEVLEQCSKLFSNNYGIWGEKGPKPGDHVKMSPTKLREQLLSSPEATILVVCYRATEDRQLDLVGHAFATAWDYGHDGLRGRVGWVTQLVVSLAARKRYIATSLLQMLKSCKPFRDITAIGLVSSHPSACHALAKYTSNHIQSVDLNFCRQNVKAIIKAAPVEYVRTMQVHRSLLDDEFTSGTALAVYKSDGKWVLGDLLVGHEFLVILPVQGSTRASH